MAFLNSKKKSFQQKVSFTNKKSKFEKVTARVTLLDFDNKKIILDCFHKPAYCLFRDLGNLSYREISRIFKVSSVHTFAKIKYNNELESINLNYKYVHPETQKQGKNLIIPTYSGSKNLNKFLDKLIRKENYEKDSNSII